MAYSDPKKQAESQRRYRRRKAAAKGAKSLERSIRESERYWRRVENEAYARAAMEAYKEARCRVSS